jgi:hypothetical protein
MARVMPLIIDPQNDFMGEDGVDAAGQPIP